MWQMWGSTIPAGAGAWAGAGALRLIVKRFQ